MKRKRILIVDDEVSFTRLLKLNLEATGGYEVRVENAPELAVATARAFQPDLIVLDVMMPRLFGGNLANQIQSDPVLQPVPLVFLTATMPKEKEEKGRIGGFPFLAKPASADEVIAFIEKHLPKAAA